MYSFEGDFRRKPIQSLGGASKKEQRTSLLHRTQEERRKREDLRLQQSSATKIQSFYRAATIREQEKDQKRQEFDTLLSQKDADVSKHIDVLHKLARYLLFFYKENEDEHRLTQLCQLLLKNKDRIAEWTSGRNTTGLYQLKHLLWLSCSYLKCIASTSNPIAVPMRMVETFTDEATYRKVSTSVPPATLVQDILLFLVQKGYYRCMRMLVDNKIPASLERTVSPPTPQAASIMDLVVKPLNCVPKVKDVKFRNAVLQSLCREFFCCAYSEQISQFVLPALAYSNKTFPFVELLHALLPLSNIAVPSNESSSNQIHDNHLSLTVEPSPWLLHAVLMISERNLGYVSKEEVCHYLYILQKLVPQLQFPRRQVTEDSDSEDEEEMMQVDGQTGLVRNLSEVREECARLLDQPDHVKAIVSTVSRDPEPVLITAACTVCHTLMSQNKLSVHKTRLLYSLAFNPVFVRNLWYTCTSVSTRSVTGSQVPLIQMLSRGLAMSWQDINRIVPLLSVFVSLFSHSLMSLHDTEFYGEDQAKSRSSMPFSIRELVPLSKMLLDVSLGLIELAHPDTKPTVKEDYKKAFKSVGVRETLMTADELQKQQDTWAYLFKVVTNQVKQLYARDTRRPFCPHGHWLAKNVHINADKPSQLYRAQNPVFMRRPFGALSNLNRKAVLEEEGQPLTTTEVRNLVILTELPFVVPFAERVKIFHRLIYTDKVENQGEMHHFMSGPMINIMIRRNYLYEDAFEKLSPENEPNLKLKIQVQLVNFAGLDEAGIDGGGIFREFMAELLKTSFDPNRGFFKMTLDRLLYPNHQSEVLIDNFTKHYYFLGRILGKAVYENMLIELPFASFFLSKILSRHGGDVDIHHLASLDPEMYKNLLFLKDYEGDVADLGLDFTVVNNDFGDAQVEELKPGGRDMAVNNSNKIQYMHLMADYRLNRQIRTHCYAFRQGMADVINLDWLRMFDCHELQVLISGAQVPVNVEDLKKHTNYSGGYTEDHKVIQHFWKSVEGFTDTQKRQLLKFVTSCSRSPLLGFKDLFPAFCIHNAGSDEDRLPTASTCMNLLKLPEFRDEKTLREKLLYAIESGAGFELS